MKRRLLRAAYPFPIDLLEHGAILQVDRVRAGQPIYVEPTLGYVPMIYGPLYFYLAGAVTAVVREPLLGLRLVSFAASATTRR